MKSKRIGCFLAAVCLAAVLLLMPKQPQWMENGVSTQAERTIAAFAAENGLDLSDYPDDLVALLERNPETEEFVLRYPLDKDKASEVQLPGLDAEDGVPLFLQWDSRWGYLEYGGKPAGLTACGPVCLSMAACYLTRDDAYAPDKMIEFAKDGGYYSPGSGSNWTLISQGGVELGFEVTELPMVKKRIFDHLETGNPIICAMGKGDFTTSGHFIVLVGTQDGLLRVNDPNSIKNSNKLWKFEDIESQFRNLWAIGK